MFNFKKHSPLFCSALILPGSGEFILGRRIIGSMLASLVISELLVMISIFFMSFLSVARSLSHQQGFWDQFFLCLKLAWLDSGTTILIILGVIFATWLTSVLQVTFMIRKKS